jgi:hypothetical protein
MSASTLRERYRRSSRRRTGSDASGQPRWVHTQTRQGRYASTPLLTPNLHHTCTRRRTSPHRPPCHSTAAQLTAGTHWAQPPSTSSQPPLPTQSSNRTHARDTGRCTTNTQTPHHVTTMMTLCPTAGIQHPAGSTPNHPPWTHNPRTNRPITTGTTQQATTTCTLPHSSAPNTRGATRWSPIMTL